MSVLIAAKMDKTKSALKKLKRSHQELAACESWAASSFDSYVKQRLNNQRVFRIEQIRKTLEVGMSGGKVKGEGGAGFGTAFHRDAAAEGADDGIKN